MYATIKGTLTENDGVFSGFSSSNYLQLQQNYPINNSIDFVLDITIGATDKTNMTLFEFSTKRIILYRPNTTQNYFILAIGGLSLTDSMHYEINNNYKLKFTITTSGIKIYYYDNNSWVFDRQYDLVLTDFSNVYIGNRQALSSPFDNGSIDLNNSYIKLGSTKYNLQAVVGYTVVGSPTIVDGVVSGFSNSDYLKLPSFDFANSNSWKIKFAFELDNNISDWGSIFDNSYIKSGLAFYLDNNQKVYFYGGDGTNDTFIKRSNIINANQKYYVQVEFTGNSYILSLSTDNINWTIVNTTESNIRLSNTIYDSSYIGYSFRYNGRALIGKIYIKECLIYKDKKLWFNGYER